jgi:hypothetical protein
VHPRSGVQALEDIGVLPSFSGTIVHDGWCSYEIYTQAAHAQCGAHLLRHLNDVDQTIAFELWTRQLAGILTKSHDADAGAAAAGQCRVPASLAAQIRAEPGLVVLCSCLVFELCTGNAFAFLARREHYGDTPKPTEPVGSTTRTVQRVPLFAVTDAVCGHGNVYGPDRTYPPPPEERQLGRSLSPPG